MLGTMLGAGFNWWTKHVRLLHLRIYISVETGFKQICQQRHYFDKKKTCSLREEVIFEFQIETSKELGKIDFVVVA